MGFFDSIGKGLSEFDLSRKNSLASKAAKVAGTGGLSLVAKKGSKLDKALSGLDDAARDTSRVGVAGFNAVGAAVGARGAKDRLKSNLQAGVKQIPIVMAAAKGFAAGGPVGAFAAGGATLATTYVVPKVWGPTSEPGAVATVPFDPKLASVGGVTPAAGAAPAAAGASGSGPLLAVAAAAVLLL